MAGMFWTTERIDELRHLRKRLPLKRIARLFRKSLWCVAQACSRHGIRRERPKRTLTDWSRIGGVKPATICQRLRRGWKESEAITKPVR